MADCLAHPDAKAGAKNIDERIHRNVSQSVWDNGRITMAWAKAVLRRYGWIEIYYASNFTNAD